MAKRKAPAKKTEKRSSFISKAPVRRLMKNEGASLVSDDAVEILIKKIEEHGIFLTKKAITLVKDEKRKRLTADDINWAMR